MEFLTIGADPELVAEYRDNDSLISASSILIDAHRRKKLGLDGRSSTIELRPTPQTDPRNISIDIKRILERNKKTFLGMKLVVDQKNAPVGGHIHFGHPKLINNLNLQQILTNNLSKLLGSPMENTEDKYSYQYRRNTGYGGVLDARPQPHGFEYRALSSFIVNKQVTDAVFCTAYAIGYDTIYHGLNYSYQDITMDQVISTIKSLTLYEKYKTEIDYYFEMISTPIIISNIELKNGWGITYRKINKPSLEQINSIYKNYIFTKPSDNLIEHITYNPNDIEIPQIAKRVNHILNLINPKIPSKYDFYIYGLKTNQYIKLTAPKKYKSYFLKIDQVSNDNIIKLGLPLNIRIHPSYQVEHEVIKSFLLTHPQFLAYSEIDKHSPIFFDEIKDIKSIKNKINQNKKYLDYILGSIIISNNTPF